MQQIVSLIDNGADIKAGNPMRLMVMTPFMEFCFPGRPCEAERIAQLPSPRILKTHLPARLLRDHVTKNKVKVVVVIRNPLDALVSYYDFYKTNGAINYKGSWEEFFALAKDNKLLFGDVMDWTRDWWTYRDQENVHIVQYEEMKANLKAVIQRVAAFLQKDLTAAQLDRIAAATSFQSMSQRAAAAKGEPLPAACAGLVKKLQQSQSEGTGPMVR
jgi:hypothetical protein